VADDVIMTLNL